MLLRYLRHYVRTEWFKVLALVLALLIYAFVCLNDTTIRPMSYEEFAAEYGEYAYSLDKLADVTRFDREFLGNSFQEAYTWIISWRLGNYLRTMLPAANILVPFLTAGLASALLCAVFRKRRLGQAIAAGCSRRVIYLFLTVLYYAALLAVWLVAAPYLFSRYPTSDAWGAFSLFVLLGLLFSGAASFFFAFLLRRPIPAFLISVALWFLLNLMKGVIPLPAALFHSAIRWNELMLQGDDREAVIMIITECCVTGAAVAASVAGSWFCFRRRGQE